MPFKDMTNVKILGDSIYLYENFLSKKEILKINKKLNKVKENKWNVMWDVNWKVPSISPKTKLTHKIAKRLKKITDGYIVHGNEVFSRLTIGIGWPEHSDNSEFQEIRKSSENLKVGDPYKFVHNTQYGVVVYINDNYEGGEIYYVNQNVIYKPKAGDLIIHSSEEKCKHGVKEVISGARYAWSSNLGKLIKVPIE